MDNNNQIINLINHLLKLNNNTKTKESNKNNTFKLDSFCNIFPIHIENCELLEIIDIDKSSGELLIKVKDLDTNKEIIIGSNHPKLTIDYNYQKYS